jgi:hypothetical protein
MFDALVADSSRRNGRKGWCRACERSRSRLYYRENREAVRERATAGRPAAEPRQCLESDRRLPGCHRYNATRLVGTVWKAYDSVRGRVDEACFVWFAALVGVLFVAIVGALAAPDG